LNWKQGNDVTDNEPIVKEIYIDASPDLVFSFLSERDKMLRWTGLTLDVDPQPGGVFCLNPNTSEVVRGEYLELIRPRRIVFTWGWEDGTVGVPPGSTVVEIELVAKGDGTLVRLTHRDLPGGAVRPMHDAGWNQMLERLRIVAEGGDPGPNPGCPTDRAAPVVLNSQTT
jgi:uncharacterized protein YndB with AHSA1/START domain